MPEHLLLGWGVGHSSLALWENPPFVPLQNRWHTHYRQGHQLQLCSLDPLNIHPFPSFFHLSQHLLLISLLILLLLLLQTQIPRQQALHLVLYPLSLLVHPVSQTMGSCCFCLHYGGLAPTHKGTVSPSMALLIATLLFLHIHLDLNTSITNQWQTQLTPKCFH